MNLNNPFDAAPNDGVNLSDDPLPTDANHPNQTGIGEQTFIREPPPPSQKEQLEAERLPTFSYEPVEEAPPKYSKKHHNIIDMYWLINEKLFAKQPLLDGEAGFLALGYNADFANLRVGFHMPDQESFTRSSMIKDKMKFMTTLNIFSETAYHILDCLRTQRDINVSNFERIIGVDNKWVPNQTQITGNTQAITIKTKNPEGNIFSYTFSGWQITCFASALKYMTEGNSWNKYLDVRMQ